MTTPQCLALSGISKTYEGQDALSGIDLDVPAGNYVVLLGPSGSGKTTLLSIVGGFTPPSAGRVLIGERDVTLLSPAERPTATVFQDYALFPHLDVGGNVGFGLSVRGTVRAERLRLVDEALRLVGLVGFSHRQIAQLSGGQRQRVALARALVVEPAVLLLDEPLGALDLHLRRQMQDELKALQKATGRSFVHVTHDQEEAMALADVIVVMNKGRIEDVGPPHRVYARPATRFTATFMGESTLIEGRILRRDDQSVRVETALGEISVDGAEEPGTNVAISIRPERMRLRPAEGLTRFGPALVNEIVFQGGFVRVLAVAPDGTPILVKALPEQAPEIGATIEPAAAPADLVLVKGAV
jgi:spermidine/putrescine transport system ATP-binding protein